VQLIKEEAAELLKEAGVKDILVEFQKIHPDELEPPSHTYKFGWGHPRIKLKRKQPTAV